jgi:precorrin-6B methylase 2
MWIKLERITIDVSLVFILHIFWGLLLFFGIFSFTDLTILTTLLIGIDGIVIYGAIRYGIYKKTPFYSKSLKQCYIVDFYCLTNPSKNAREFTVASDPWGSWSELYKNKTDTWAYFDFLRKLLGPKMKTFSNALILGGGGAAMPIELTQQNKDIDIDAVEIDESVVAIAKTYFLQGKYPNIQVHQEDAITFIETKQKRYDFIFVDIFSGETMPESITTPGFSKRIHELLKDTGIVIVNLGVGGHKEVHDMTQQLKKQFSKGHIYIDEENIFFVSGIPPITSLGAIVL